MSQQLHVERIRVGHLPEVLPIERRSYPSPWSVAMFVLELTRPHGVSLGIRESGADGPLLGYVVCSPQDEEWHIMNVTVDPEHRRRGAARQLLRAVHARLGEATDGEARFTLEVRPSNRAALALYADEGYLVAGRRPRYYPDNGEDALIMWRTPGTRAGSFHDVPAPDLRVAAQWNEQLLAGRGSA